MTITIKITIKRIIITAVLLTVTAVLASTSTIGFDSSLKEYLKGRETVSATT